MRHGDLKFSYWRINILKQEIISAKNEEPSKLTETHYMFCGTSIEKHWPTFSGALVNATAFYVAA